MLPIDPPCDPVYDDLEVWKVTITWDNEEYETKYIPYIGYDSHLMLDDFKRDFYKEVMKYVGYASPSLEQEFVYSILSRAAIFQECWDNGYADTLALLFDIASYPAEEPYKIKYYKKDITDWLKDNQERWVKIEVIDFWKVPEEEQKEIRSFIEENKSSSLGRGNNANKN